MKEATKFQSLRVSFIHTCPVLITIRKDVEKQDVREVLGEVEANENN